MRKYVVEMLTQVEIFADGEVEHDLIIEQAENDFISLLDDHACEFIVKDMGERVRE